MAAYDNFAAFPAGSAATASVTGTTASALGFKTLSVQAIATGSPVGSIQVQVSNDPVGTPAQVVNWGSPTGSYALAISAAGVVQTPTIPDFCWRWVRVNYIFTSGTGTITANVEAVVG